MDDRTVDKKWFLDRLAEIGMSQRQLAKRIGVDQSSISLTFNGKRKMTPREAGQIAQVVGPRELPAGTVAVQARTAASGVDTIDGWIFFYVPGKAVDTEAINRLSVVKVSGGRTYLAHIRRGYTEGRYNLMMFSGKMDQDVEIEWAAPVLWVRT